MKKVLYLALLAALCAATTQAQVVVQIDDLGTSTGYVDGVGGAFSGADALVAAIDAINDDPTTNTTFEVQITDTDGAADTYVVATLNLDTTGTTIRQVANGGGTDVGVTIQTTTETVGVIQFNTPDCALIGLSDAVRIQLEIATSGGVSWGTGGLGPNAQVENVDFVGGAPGKLAVNHGGDNIQFTNVDFVAAGNGPQIAAGDVTYTNVVFASTAFPFVFTGLGTPVDGTFVNCDVTLLNQFHLANAGVVTFAGCTFDVTGLAVPVINAGSLLRDGTVVIMNDPVFTGPMTNIFINNLDTSVTLRIAGSPGSPVDTTVLRTGVGEGLIGRSRAGTIEFIDCLIDDRYDCAGAPGPNANVNFMIERCTVVGADFGAVNVAGINRFFTVRNTTWEAAVAPRPSSISTASGGGDGGIVIEHSTFYGNPVNQFIGTDSNTPINLRYCIFEPDAAGDLNNAGKVTGDFNVLFGGVTVNGTNQLANTITADPLLDASGKLQSGSSAIDAALASQATLDFEGDARPAGNAKDIGADESPFSAAVSPVPAFVNTPYDLGLIPDGGSFTVEFERGVDYDDLDGDPLTVSLVGGSHSGPGTGAWLNLDAAATTFTLSGTAQDLGLHTWTLRVADDDTNFGEVTVSITVVDASLSVNVVVDDVPGNDAPYVNGSGGNFTGPDALVQAVAAVNADPTLGLNEFLIQIIDTDGVADTYTGDLELTKADTKIRQVAGGSGADVGVTLVSNNTVLGAAFRLVAANTELSGLAPDNPIVLDGNSTSAPAILGGDTRSANMLVQNVRTIGATAGASLSVNSSAGDMRFVECTFNNSGNGPQIVSPGTARFEYCNFGVPGFPLVALTAGQVVVSTSTISGGAHLHLGGDPSNVLLTDCEFNWTGPSIIAEAPLTTGSVLTLERPVFNNPVSGIAFHPGDIPMTIVLQGARGGARTDLRNIKDSGNLARVRAGRFVVNDCIVNDTMDAGGETLPVLNRVDFEFNRSIVESPVGFINTAGGARGITATNTIFNANGFNACMSIDQAGPGSTITLTHCTLYGFAAGGNLIATSPANNAVVANYCIFDASQTDDVAANAVATGAGNIVWSGTIGTNLLTGTLNVNPLLSSDGRLTPRSPGIDAAVGSSATVDVDDDVRPFGDERDIGADEATFRNSAESWMLFE